MEIEPTARLEQQELPQKIEEPTARLEQQELLQRVTQPSEPETRNTKDPKKVEAGRKSAAARKAKQERLLAELREAKASLAVPPTLKAVPQQTRQTDAKSEATPTDWTSIYILGCLSIVGALWFIGSQSRGTGSSRGQAKTSTVSAVPPSAVSAKHLKSGPNPFYMQ